LLRYLVARVLGMIVMIVLATLVVFVIANQVPADPILAQLGDMQAADEALVAAYRAR
jgi:peptide/nickel transport system permease protein